MGQARTTGKIDRFGIYHGWLVLVGGGWVELGTLGGPEDGCALYIEVSQQPQRIAKGQVVASGPQV